jgi:hypothetical protein
VNRFGDERQDHAAHYAGDVEGVTDTFKLVQRTDIVMRFLGASPVVFLAGSTAVPACTARAPLAVPGIEADNAKAGCHEW